MIMLKGLALEGLPSVIAAFRAADLGGFDRLTVAADRTGRGGPPGSNAGLFA